MKLVKFINLVLIKGAWRNRRRSAEDRNQCGNKRHKHGSDKGNREQRRLGCVCGQHGKL